MSKLIYAASKSGFETAYPNRAITDAVYRSLVFTTDGYLWTHGVYFRIIPDNGTSTITSDTAGNGSVVLRDKNNLQIGSIDVGVTNVTASGILSASALTNGAIAITHNNSALAAGNHGPTEASDSNINVLQLTTDAQGHITAATNRLATLNRVKSTVVATAGDQYITFAASGTTTSELNKAADLKFNPGTGLFSATTLAGTLNKNLSITLNNAAPVVFDNSVDKVVPAFFAPITGGTAGQLLKSNGTTAPTWITPVESITSGSTNAQIPTAKAVWSAIGDGMTANDAMVFKGVINASANPNYPAADVGHTYKISVAGKIGGASGPSVEVGDTIICIADAAAGTHAVVGASWSILQTNIVGAVTTGGALPSGTIVLGGGSSSISTLPNAGTSGYLLIGNTGTTAPSWTAPGSFTIQVNSTAFGTAYAPTTSKTLNLVGGTNVTLAPSGNSVTINSTYTNTASAVNNILEGSNSGTAIKYAPYAAQQASLLSFDISTTNPTLATRLNLNGHLYATRLYSAGVEVLTTHQTIHKLTVRQYVGTTTTVITEYTPNSGVDTLQFTQGTAIALDSTANSGIMTISHGAISGASTVSASKYVTATDSFGHVTGTADFSLLTFSSPTNSGVNGAGNAIRTTTTYAPTGAKTINLIAGANTIIQTSSNTITISSTDTNTWRNVSAYSTGATSTLGQVLPTTIGTADLQFGNEFIWDATGDGTNGPELKLGWAEVTSGGVITYSF